MQEQRIIWEWEINSKTSWLGSSLKELILYKDLLWQMVRRSYILYYQQTLLGPLWMVINPILTSIVYIFVFNKVIGVSTSGAPPFAFYLAGISLWTLFSDIFSGTNNIYAQNAYVFSKVYFPRIIVPLSTTLLHLIRFSIQLIILAIVIIYYSSNGSIPFSINGLLLFIPSVIMISMISLGAGLIFTVITAKYKDMGNVLGLVVRLLMFITPIFYSMAIVPEKIRWIVELNPMSSLFEMFRYSLIGTGTFQPSQVLYSFVCAVTFLTGGVLLFNKTNDRVVDVV